MIQSTVDVKQYGINAQQYLLSQVFSNPDLFVRCKNILKPEYFDKTFHESIQYVHDYAAKYSSSPTLKDIEVKGGYQYDQYEVQELHKQAVLDTCSEFCRHKALALAVEKGMELVHQKKYGGIEELIREAMLVSVQNELGLDIFENPEDTIRSLSTMQGSFKSGWETLDYKLFGGFGRRELEIFAAASGGGKSVVLQNLAVNFAKAGMNGAYISLELAEELVAVRIYGMMTESKLSNVKNEAEKIGLQVQMEGKDSGILRIKRLPESVTTTDDVESYLRELQIKMEVKLDYVCVDYLDLLTSNRLGPNDKSNTFTKDKFVSEELRALATKMDLTVFTASQFNRSGMDEDKKSQSQIAGGISKIYTADNVIYIEARKETGELWFDFQKTRNSSAVGSRLRMSYDIDSLRVLDHATTIQQFETDGSGFRHSGISKVGGGNMAMPPSTMQTLRHTLSGAPKPSTTPSVESVTLNTDSDPITSTQTESQPQQPHIGTDRVNAMKQWLNQRK